jgi:hypothetical protein
MSIRNLGCSLSRDRGSDPSRSHTGNSHSVLDSVPQLFWSSGEELPSNHDSTFGVPLLGELDRLDAGRKQNEVVEGTHEVPAGGVN